MLACGTARAPRDQKLSKSQSWCAKCAYAAQDPRLHLEAVASVGKTLAIIFAFCAAADRRTWHC